MLFSSSPPPRHFTPCQNFLPQTAAHLHKHAKERFPVVCPQGRKLSSTGEVAATSINSDLRTKTKRQAEILQKTKPQLPGKGFLKSFVKCSWRGRSFAQISGQICFYWLFSRDEKPCAMQQYLHTSQVTVPL